MALPQLKLDERSFQDLVDEAKLRIPRYCPEWTNHNVSDPGVTLIELFAYMVDQLLYQVNRVPEKNYRSFLDMIGVKLAPPNAARAEVTFRLTAAQPNPITIPKGTEVATVRTESQPAQIFTTEDDLVIGLPHLKYVLTTANLHSFTDNSKAALESNTAPLKIFPDQPHPNNAFYLGFGQNIGRNTLVLELDCEKLGVGINPYDPPLVWEYWDGLQDSWQALDIEQDATEGLTAPFSTIEFYVPPTIEQREIELMVSSEDRVTAWWVRCRYKELARNQAGYNQSPLINRIQAYNMGGTIGANHSQVVRLEDLGRSSGEPGQRFRLKNVPMLALSTAEQETVLVEPPDDRAPELWQAVPDFGESGPTDRHFVCDPVNGEITFGPALRNPHGEESQYGAIPPYSSRLIMTSYRTGGGTSGNVGSQTITVLKSAIPYVQSVTNRRAAAGGTSAESLEHALLRGPRTLRARNRAVTAEDFEVLTREATSGVGRVRCLAPGPTDRPEDAADRVEPGTVVLLVVPEVESSLRDLRPEHLAIPASMRGSITEYLDERRLLTTRIELTTPNYTWVTVQARIKTLNSYANERVKREAERRLYQFIRPVQGGPDPTMRFDPANPGEGWPFGRVLYLSEIYPILQTIEGVEFVEKVELFPVTDLARGQADAPAALIRPGARGMVCSYRHQIVLI